MNEKMDSVSELMTEPAEQAIPSPTQTGWLRSFFVPPMQNVAQDDIEATLQAGRERLLTAILRGNAILAGLALAAFIITNFNELRLGEVVVFLSVYFGLVIFAFVRRIPYSVRGAILLAWIYGLGLQGLLATGLSGDGRLLMFTFVILSFFLFNLRIGIFALLMGLGTLLFTAWQMTTGRILVPVEVLANSDNVSSWVTGSFTFLALIGIVLLALVGQVRDIQNIWRRQRSLQQALQQERAFLEQRVAERTRALGTSVEISRQLSSNLEVDKLAHEVVEKIRTAFNYYHAQIYVIDEQDNKLAIVAGTGAAGQAMLTTNQKIDMNSGIIGRAAESKQVVHVPDVAQETTWLSHPLLPETQCEVAVPVMLGERLLGVLDVQHNRVNGVTADDIALLRSIADQIAVALQNARVYLDAQTQAKREAVINKIGQKIRLATSVEDVLQVAARELATSFELPKVEINLQNSKLTNGNRSG